MAASTTARAEDIPCYAIYISDHHFSDEWGNFLVALWIRTKQALEKGLIEVSGFRDALIDGIVERDDWCTAFAEAAREVGANPNDERLFREYKELHRGSAFDLIPSNLHAEFCYIPGWDGENLDDLIEECGIRSERWKSTYVEDLVPGNWLSVFLQTINQSSDEMISAAVRVYGADGEKFARRCQEAGFTVGKDATRPSLMTGEQAVAAVENAYCNAVTVVHCEMNVRALFEHDPTCPMRLSTRCGKVHVGLHEFVNGAGYIDTYPGDFVVPADARGFAGVERWAYGIDSTYGIVRHVFNAIPVPA